jgi:hypothetical protein
MLLLAKGRNGWRLRRSDPVSVWHQLRPLRQGVRHVGGHRAHRSVKHHTVSYANPHSLMRP